MFKSFIVFLLVFLSIKCFAQTTPNIGFEDGTFNHWELEAGTVNNVTNALQLAPIASPIFDRFTIFDRNLNDKTTDPNAGFPVMCPTGGRYSVRLGNTEMNPRGAPGNTEHAAYTFTVPSLDSYSVIFNYAVVLQNPTHTADQQPRFTVKIFDVTDNNTRIACPSFDFVSGSTVPGFTFSQISADTNNNGVFYKDWSSATIDLRGYANKQIRIEFTVNDCSLGQHFGYAYIDINEGATNAPITGNTICNNQHTATLNGPVGFATYDWYNADMSVHLGSGQSITLDPAPAAQTKIALKITPFPDLGECDDILYTVINRIGTDFNLNVAHTVDGCTGIGVNLTAAAVTAGSSSDMVYTYFNDNLGTSYIHDPKAVLIPGTYYIRGVNTEGCTDILPVIVTIGLPETTITQPAAVVYPTIVDITKTFTMQPGIAYSYYSDAAATKPITNYYTIGHGGTYYVKAENSTGCITISPVIVVVNPPPPYTISAPNTFTPNNDGVNDYFSVHIDGFVSLNNLKIFNRYGQLVFTTRFIDTKWDGNFSGRQLPVGTYYWVFEGIDQYYYTKVSKGGSITIVR